MVIQLHNYAALTDMEVSLHNVVLLSRVKHRNHYHYHYHKHNHNHFHIHIHGPSP